MQGGGATQGKSTGCGDGPSPRPTLLWNTVLLPARSSCQKAGGSRRRRRRYSRSRLLLRPTSEGVRPRACGRQAGRAQGWAVSRQHRLRADGRRSRQAGGGGKSVGSRVGSRLPPDAVRPAGGAGRLPRQRMLLGLGRAAEGPHLEEGAELWRRLQAPQRRLRELAGAALLPLLLLRLRLTCAGTQGQGHMSVGVLLWRWRVWRVGRGGQQAPPRSLPARGRGGEEIAAAAAAAARAASHRNPCRSACRCLGPCCAAAGCRAWLRLPWGCAGRLLLLLLCCGGPHPALPAACQAAGC